MPIHTMRVTRTVWAGHTVWSMYTKRGIRTRLRSRSMGGVSLRSVPPQRSCGPVGPWSRVLIHIGLEPSVQGRQVGGLVGSVNRRRWGRRVGEGLGVGEGRRGDATWH